MTQNKILSKTHQRLVSCLLCFILHNSLLATVEVPPIPFPAPETVTLSEEKAGIQGNWRKKKQYLVESNKIFDSIQNLLVEIQGARKYFNEKFHVIDDEFDKFYMSEGLDQGKLQELFESLERYIEKKQKKKLALLTTKPNDKEDLADQNQIESLEADLKRDKDNLEQLRFDLKSIDDLDKSIEDRLKRVDEQIAQAKNLFDKAKISIEELWDIIDDKKARVIFYELKGSILENIKNINAYLKEDLARDFDTVIETARTQMKKTKESIKKLEDSEIIIKNRFKRIEQIKLEQKQIELAKQAAAQIKTKEEKIDLKKTTNWYDKIYDYIITMISKAYKYLNSLYNR